MPPKSGKAAAANFGHPENKKKENKNKPTVEGAKKDEEEKTEVSDKEDHDEGSSASDTASGHAKVENPVAVAGGSSGDRNVEPAKFKQVEIPGKGQGPVAGRCLCLECLRISY